MKKEILGNLKHLLACAEFEAQLSEKSFIELEFMTDEDIKYCLDEVEFKTDEVTKLKKCIEWMEKNDD